MTEWQRNGIGQRFSTQTTNTLHQFIQKTAAESDKVLLRVYRFVNGKQNPPDSFLIQHSIILWDVASQADLFGVGGDGPNSEGFSPALSLSFSVSKDAYYNLWVYFKTGASAEGGGLTYASGAMAEMNGYVTSMRWTLVF
jgi:hypothetical protein